MTRWRVPNYATCGYAMAAVAALSHVFLYCILNWPKIKQSIAYGTYNVLYFLINCISTKQKRNNNNKLCQTDVTRLCITQGPNKFSTAFAIKNSFFLFFTLHLNLSVCVCVSVFISDLIGLDKSIRLHATFRLTVHRICFAEMVFFSSFFLQRLLCMMVLVSY